MEYSSRFVVNILNIEETTLKDSEKLYLVLKVGDQSIKSAPFCLQSRLINQNYSFSSTEKSGSIFLYKKSLLRADLLIGESSFNIDLESFDPVTCSFLDHNTSEYVASVRLEIKLESVPSIINSLFPVHSGLNPIKMTDNFRDFVMRLGFLARLKKRMYGIFSWQSPSETLLVVFGLYLFSLYKEYTPCFVLIGLWLWVVYYGTFKKEEEELDSHTIYLNNLIFIQETMGTFTYAVDFVSNLKENVVYWKDPEKAKLCLRYIEIALIPLALYCYFYNFMDIVIYSTILSLLHASSFLQIATAFGYLRFKALIDSKPLESASPKENSPKSSRKRVFRIYENQRMWLGSWKNYTFPIERGNWSDVNGTPMSMESLKLPPHCEWEDSWTLEKHEDEGWEYAHDFTKNFHSHKEPWDYVRRRSWIRTAIKMDKE